MILKELVVLINISKFYVSVFPLSKDMSMIRFFVLGRAITIFNLDRVILASMLT